MSVLKQIEVLLEQAEMGLFQELFPEYMLDYFEQMDDATLIREVNKYFGCRLTLVSVDAWLREFECRFIPCLFHE